MATLCGGMPGAASPTRCTCIGSADEACAPQQKDVEPGRIAMTRLIIPFVLGVLGPVAIVGYLLLVQ